MASLISTAQAALFALLDGAKGAQSVNDLDQRSMPALNKVKAGSLIKALKDQIVGIDVTREVRSDVAVYDFAVHGGVKDVAIPIGTALPAKAYIVRAWIEGLTTMTSAGAATAKIGFAGATTNVLGVTGKASFVAATPLASVLDAGAVATYILPAVCAGNKLLVEIGTANLTAGKFAVHYEYCIGV